MQQNNYYFNYLSIMIGYFEEYSLILNSISNFLIQTNLIFA